MGCVCVYFIMLLYVSLCTARTAGQVYSVRCRNRNGGGNTDRCIPVFWEWISSKTGFGKHLITNPSWWDNLDSLSFNMLEGTSYTTLYNPNFLSFYFGNADSPACVCVYCSKKWHGSVF